MQQARLQDVHGEHPAALHGASCEGHVAGGHGAPLQPQPPSSAVGEAELVELRLAAHPRPGALRRVRASLRACACITHPLQTRCGNGVDPRLSEWAAAALEQAHPVRAVHAEEVPARRFHPGVPELLPSRQGALRQVAEGLHTRLDGRGSRSRWGGCRLCTWLTTRPSTTPG